MRQHGREGAHVSLRATIKPSNQRTVMGATNRVEGYS